jgi:aspartate racemase
MTSVGLVGGLGPESTIDYYRRILERWRESDPATAPSIVIDSLDVQLALHLVATDRQALVEYLLGSVGRLAGAGADFVAMTANTPHIVFDELARASPVPLLSIVEACAAEARRHGLRRPLLLGTRFTMEATFYPVVFARSGMTIVVPNEAERSWLHERYVGELLNGTFLTNTLDRLVEIIGQIRDREHIDGVLLAGTELPLLFDRHLLPGLPLVDTTEIHVAAIVARLRGR